MRKNFNHLMLKKENRFYNEIQELLNNLKDIFEDNQIKKLKERNFLFIELLLYSNLIIFDKKEMGLKDATAIFTNYEENILNGISNYNKEIAKYTIFLLKPIFTKKIFLSECNFYFNDIDQKYRLFEYNKSNDTYYLSIPNFAPWREKIYKDILSSKDTVKHEEKRKDFLSKEHKYSKIHVTRENDKSSYNIKDIFFERMEIDETQHQFLLSKLLDARKKEKKGLDHINNYLPNDKILRKMTEISGQDWVERYEPIRLRKIDENFNIVESKFYLNKMNNIVGPLGAGKTTLLLATTFAQVKEANNKVVIIENSVIDGFDKKEKLDKLGVKSVVITGNSSIKEHQSRFINGKDNNTHNLVDFVKKEKENLKQLDYTCAIRANLDIDNEKPNPCDSLYVSHKGKTKNYCCPLYHVCGSQQKYRDMIDADVWIINYQTLFKSRIPYQWDKFQRTYFEAAYLWADLIFIDESDFAQSQIDNIFLDTQKITLNDNDKYSKNDYFIDYLLNLVPSIAKTKNADPFIRNYNNNISKTQQVLNYIYGCLLDDKYIEKQISNRTFTPYQLLLEFFNKIIVSDDIEKTTIFQDFYKNIIEDKIKFIKQNFYELNDNNFSYKEKTIEKKTYFEDEILNHWYIKYSDINFKTLNDEKTFQLTKKFEFLIYFYEFHLLLRELKQDYPRFIATAKLLDNQEFKTKFMPQADLQHTLYLESPLTDEFSAYKYNPAENSMSFQLLSYEGIGRQLMYNIHKSFMYIEDTPEPVTILMSATSYLKESSTFNIEVKPNWLLERRLQDNQVIKSYFKPLYNNGTPLYISGSKDEDERLDNARKMAKVLVQDNHITDMIQDLEKEYKSNNNDKKRIIAIATSSFGLAQAFGQTLYELVGNKYTIKVQYASDKYLSGKYIVKNPEYHIEKTEIEQLYETDVDIFVFVWNSIGRGFNILQSKRSDKSLIGKLLILNRPYAIPGDFNDQIAQLHAFYPQIMKNIKNKNLNLNNAVSYIRRTAFARLEESFGSEMIWSQLSSEERYALSANMLITIQQTIGRGLRGGTDLEVYFIDSKFAPETAKNLEVPSDTEETSILVVWEKLLNKTDELSQILYGKFAESLKGLVSK